MKDVLGEAATDQLSMLGRGLTRLAKHFHWEARGKLYKKNVDSRGELKSEQLIR